MLKWSVLQVETLRPYVVDSGQSDSEMVMACPTLRWAVVKRYAGKVEAEDEALDMLELFKLIEEMTTEENKTRGCTGAGEPRG